MRVATFQAVRQRFGFCCGYCGISETEAGANLTIDHFQPRSHSGSNAFANLVYACHACNEFKRDYWNPGGVERILHPIHDTISIHYIAQGNGELQTLTDTGAFHIARLELNRPALVLHRHQKKEKETERQERSEILLLMRQATINIAELQAAIQDLRSGGE